MLRPAGHLDRPEIASLRREPLAVGSLQGAAGRARGVEGKMKASRTALLPRAHGEHAHCRLWGGLIVDVETQA